MLLVSNMKCVYITKTNRFLSPGNNIIPEDEAKILLGMEDITEKVAMNLFNVIKEEEAPAILKKDGETEKSPIEKSVELIMNYKEAGAIKAVSGLLDVKVIDALLKKETRPEVLKVLKKQSKVIRDRKEKDTGSKNTYNKR